MGQLVKHTAVRVRVVTGKQTPKKTLVIRLILLVKNRCKVIRGCGVLRMRGREVTTAWMHYGVPGA